jgi:hypothetical protein
MPATPDQPRATLRAGVLLGLAILCLSWLWWSLDAMPPPTEPEQDGEAAAATAPPSPEQVEHERAVLELVPEPIDFGEEPPDADLEHRYQFALSVHVCGPFGLPVDDAQVFLAPEMSGFSVWPEDTRAGRVQLRWRGRQRVMHMQVAVLAWGVLQPMRMVTVEAEVAAQLAFQVHGRQQDLTVLMQHAEMDEKEVGRAGREMRRLQRQRRQRMDELDFLCGRTLAMFRMTRCAACHDRSMLAAYSPISRSGKMAPGLHPASQFEDLRRHALHGQELEDRLAALRAQLRKRGVDEQEQAERFRARVKGRVVGADGAAAVGVRVAWLDDQGSVLRAVATDANGRYLLAPIQGGEQHLVVGGGILGTADMHLRVADSGDTVCDFLLTISQSVVGRVLDEGGDPLQGWRVELVCDAAGWAKQVGTNKLGEFAAYGVPGPVQCLVWPKEADSAFPVIFGIESLVDASAIQLALRAEHPVRGRLRLKALLPTGFEEQQGWENSRIDARVMQLETGRVAQMKPFAFANEFVAEPLAPGKYRVQVGAPGLGWQQREVFVDGRGLWDLGGIMLAAPGRVRVQQLPGAANVLEHPHAFYRRDPAVDVRVEYELREGVLWLPPGLYVFVWRTTGELRARELQVVGGEEVELRIWPDDR